MELLPMRRPEERDESEALASFFLGAPTMALSSGAIILMVSYLVDFPIGPPDFYTVQRIPQSAGTKPIEQIIPSWNLFWLLIVSTVWSALGMYFSRGRSGGRSAPTAAAGLIGSVAAFLMAWVLLLLASH